MLSFLKESKGLLNQSGRICLVLGNESCDLDSAVSAIALAFFYSRTKPEHLKDVKEFLPVLNIPRRNFPIKTEVSYFLRKHNITDEYLVFKDDMGVELIEKNSIILVDHHVSHYRDYVIEVFDHRPIDSTCKLPESCRTTIEQVGSCATLIGDLILRSQSFKDELKIILLLLYGAIVMDTVNFSPVACRKTELDSDIACKIEDILQISNCLQYRESLFSELVKAREDISSLTAYQLLHKDMKLASNINGTIKVGIPGYPIAVQEFIKLPDAKVALQKFAKELDCSVILMIGMKITNGSDVARDIGLVNIAKKDLFEEILKGIKFHDEPNLQLKELIHSNFLGGRYFQQQNIRATRKQIFPIVKNILKINY